ncbi:MAG: phosphoglycerate kinase [Pontixanthobacter sp.]
MVIGGAKVKDKIEVLWKLVETADVLLIGGRMAFTFLAAQGVAVGRTAIEESWLPAARDMLNTAQRKVWPSSLGSHPDYTITAASL